MKVKDYYTILDTPPGSALSEVKKNFRRLALRYHPDTNQGNPYAAAWYAEIQEAYQVLSNDKLREDYHQKRWLMQASGKKMVALEPLTPMVLLQKAENMVQETQNMDHYRLDNSYVQAMIADYLQPLHTGAFHGYNEPEVVDKVLNKLFGIMNIMAFPFIAALKNALLALAEPWPKHTLRVQDYYKSRARAHYWDKRRDWVLLLVALLLCAVLYYLGK